jgi:transposase InsO family protein
MENVEGVKKKSKGKESPYGRRYAFEIKLRCVKLNVEEGVPFSLISKEVGSSTDVIRRWVRTYQEQGEAGLRNQAASTGSRRKLPPAVRDKIVEIKKREPFFGVQRISHLLKRAFFLSASPETVRRTLQAESLIVPSKKRPQHNITRPRFFERSTPNQLWQSDIFTFRLGGRYAYLIGFIDDYSRYVVGLELYRSQTADQVLEVYRRAIGEYGVPKEMLTDQGRQYTNWRGSTRFERELGKDRVRHIKSQAHHPMTLGKIERFWKTIYEEFLVRAQFVSFEEAQERVRQWLKYYNHKRPHQGIGGLCPADRYFEIQGELRKTMEQGIADNVLEMALRGKPREPFYMVGRMEGQSVVLRAEKGKLRLLVDDEQGGGKQEMVYDVTAQEAHGHEEGDGDGKGGETRQTGDQGQEKPQELRAHGGGEMPGGALGMDGETQTGRSLPGDGSGVDSTEAMAGAGDGGDAPGATAAGGGGENGSLKPTACGIVGTKEQSRSDEETGTTASPTPGGTGQTRGIAGDWGIEEGLTLFMEMPHGEEEKDGARAGLGDPEGPKRGVNGEGGSSGPERVAQDLLRVGRAGPEGHGNGIGESSSGKTSAAHRRGEGSTSGDNQGAGEEALSSGEDD